jgi:predicted transporter
MRLFAWLLVLIGVVGVAFGILTMVGGMTGPHALPFRFEDYGGPGPLMGGIFLIAAGLFFQRDWKKRA